MPEHPPRDLIFDNCNIIDTERGQVLSDYRVHIKDGRFHSISPSSSFTSDDNARPYPITLGPNVYLCPGLIDSHVHITASPGSDRMQDLYSAHPDTLILRSAWTARAMLHRGFTTVRDTCGATYALRDAIAEGLIPGPRLFISGKALSQTGGHADMRLPHQESEFKCCGGSIPGLGRICDGVPSCLEAARDELRKGADFLKIMTGGGVASPVDPLDMVQFTAEEIRAITGAARNLGKYVTAHAYSVEAIRHAVDNGVKCIEHGNFVDQRTAEMLAARGVFVVPTLVTYHALLEPEAAQFLPESGKVKCREVLDRGLGAFKILREAGVTVCFGTDLLGAMHEKQNEEFEIRRQVQSDLEVLQSATVNPARLLRMEGKLGVIKEGALADLLILRENPLEDVTCLNRMDSELRAMIKDGRVVYSYLDELEVDLAYT